MSVSPVDGAAAEPNALARARARDHSRLVRALRLIFPALILVLIGLLAAFVVAQSLRQVAAGPKETPIQIRMVSPHFIGRDDQGREYDLTSKMAVRDDVDMQRVRLTSPVLVLQSATDRPKTITADSGLYDEGTRLLKLTGHVRADDSTNSKLASREALVDTRAGTVTGLSPLTGSGPKGAIEAGSYTAAEQNGVVVMHGGVHAVLRGK